MLYGIARPSDALQNVRVSTLPASDVSGDAGGARFKAAPTFEIIFVAEATGEVVVEFVREPTIATPTAAATTTARRRFPSTGPTLGVPIKDAVAVVLTPSGGPDHARQPEKRARTGDEGGADDGPFAPPCHERTRYDPDALEEEHDSREQ
jgi:hypothetical protein